MKVIYVSSALLKNEKNEYFLIARPEGKPRAGTFELPGGKVENGETPEHAMVRELREELGISVREEDMIPVTFLSYAYEECHVVLFFYEIKTWQGEISFLEGQPEAVWINIKDFPKHPISEADVILFKRLEKHLAVQTLGIEAQTFA